MSKYIKISDFLQDEYPTTFIVGARGVGKTISSLTEGIRNAYDNDKKFIYLRRYQSEIDTLGLPVKLLSELTELEISVESKKDKSGRKSKMIIANDKEVGFLLALSTVGKYKSNDYSDVDIIIYDEFIDIRGRELRGEVNLYFNFAMTVFRDFSKYKAVFLANATNLFNCYFVAFGVIPEKKVTKLKDLGIKIIMYETSDELNQRNETPLAKMITFIDSDDSALSNKFKDYNGFLGKLTSKSKSLYTMRIDDERYGVWDNGDKLIVSPKYDGYNKIVIDGLPNDDEKYRPDLLLRLATLLKANRVEFTDKITRGNVIKAMKERRFV